MKRIMKIFIPLLMLVMVISAGKINVSAQETEKTYTVQFVHPDSDQLEFYDNYTLYICLEGENGKKTSLYELTRDDGTLDSTGKVMTFLLSGEDIGEVKYMWVSTKNENKWGKTFNLKVDRIDINGVGFATNGFDDDVDLSGIYYSKEIEGQNVSYNNCMAVRFCRGEMFKISYICQIASVDSAGFGDGLYGRIITKDNSKVDFYIKKKARNGNKIENYLYGVNPDDISCIQFWTGMTNDNAVIEYFKFGDVTFPMSTKRIDINEYITAYPAPMKYYSFEIHTADKFYAGTNSDVYIEMIGEDGSTGAYLLDKHAYDDFERNDTDTYEFYAKDVGQIKQITLKLDGSDAWCIGYVKYEDNTYILNKWLDDYESTTFNVRSEKIGKINVGSMFGAGSVIVIVVVAVILIGGAAVVIIRQKKRTTGK